MIGDYVGDPKCSVLLYFFSSDSSSTAVMAALQRGTDRITNEQTVLLQTSPLGRLFSNSPLLGQSVGTSLPHRLVSHTAGLHLVGDVLASGLLCLGLVNELHEDSLVLEHVTLRLHVQVVVEVLVDLAGFTVLAQHSSQDSLTSHPHDLCWHSCFVATLSLTGTSVSSQSLGGEQVARAGSRVAHNWLSDDLAVLDELADVGSRVGVADIVLFSGVEPDLSLADAHDRSGQSLLCAEIDHSDGLKKTNSKKKGECFSQSCALRGKSRDHLPLSPAAVTTTLRLALDLSLLFGPWTTPSLPPLRKHCSSSYISCSSHRCSPCRLLRYNTGWVKKNEKLRSHSLVTQIETLS